eukprot:4533486-Pyramimonas_sp.AAC.1
MVRAGSSVTLHPPASALATTRLASLDVPVPAIHPAATCTLTSEEEHAVSIATAGPARPNAYATRPGSTFSAPPVAVYTPALRPAVCRCSTAE